MRTWTITMTSTVTMWLVQVWAMVAPTTQASIWTTCLPSISSERRTAVLISSLKTSFYSQLRQKTVAKSVWLDQDSREDHQQSCETYYQIKKKKPSHICPTNFQYIRSVYDSVIHRYKVTYTTIYLAKRKFSTCLKFILKNLQKLKDKN